MSILMIYGIILSLVTLVPLSIKWELKKEITVPMAVVIGLISGLIIYHITSYWKLNNFIIVLLNLFIIAILSISLLLWRFYRDPERIPPADNNAILSPADGKIIYIKKIVKGQIAFTEKNGKKFSLNDFIRSSNYFESGYLIGIGMNYLNVHVNRSPICGKVNLLKRIKGLFISLKKKEAVIQNERVLIIIENEHIKIGIIQIASRLVRKIIPFIQENQSLLKGERIGVIRFGSQVDILLPDLQGLEIKVQPGANVKAGLTIIAVLN